MIVLMALNLPRGGNASAVGIQLRVLPVPLVHLKRLVGLRIECPIRLLREVVYLELQLHEVGF